ncbi:MAG TPA: DUF547 domain-containing protein [Thioploca sp.]|nr:MAG: Ser/Thr protein kinase [Gammaproteobacteria bacterium]HDN26037.1 DUF547 domain-containing protein [Thioploca sp.]
MRKHKAPTIVGLWAFLLLFWSSLLSAAPDFDSFWNASDESNPAKFDHSAWQTILDGYLKANHPSGINRFDYARLNANSTDRKKLRDYLIALKKRDPRSYSKAEQKAYWINVYNALTVRLVVNNLVVDGYPIESIRNIGTGGYFRLGNPWKKKLIKIQSQSLTLNNIEHNILRPIWNDNRIHYAVNCASMGCPNLASEAYTAANTERLLEKGAKDYVNHSRGVQFQSNGKLLVSSIYRWYSVDFGSTNDNVITHLRQYANSTLANRLRGYRGSIAHDYNWDINKP